MRPLVVVDVDGLSHPAAGLCEVGGALEQELVFEDAVDALGHGAGDAVAALQVLVIGRAVLNAAVGVTDQRLPCLKEKKVPAITECGDSNKKELMN